MTIADLRLPHLLTMRSGTERHNDLPQGPRLPVVRISYPTSPWFVLGRTAAGLLAVAALASFSFWAGMNYQPQGAQATLPPPAAHAAPAKPAADTPNLPATWKDASIEGLSIQSLTVSRLPDGRYAYEYSIANNGRRFIGDLEISVFGTSPNRTETIRIASRAEPATGSSTPQFNVGSFLKSGGLMVLPEQFKPRAVFFQFHEQSQTRASKIVRLSPDLPE
ncbi:MAG: DUF6776 family protein [Curvibacter sp.]